MSQRAEALRQRSKVAHLSSATRLPLVPGEVRFVLTGVALQAAALVAEASRLVMVQLLVQGRGVRLNPITTM
jgi:hypothetical protein